MADTGMTIGSRINPAWWELIRLTVRQSLAYRFDIIVTFLGFAIQLYLLRVVWEAAFAGRSEMNEVSADVLLVYLSISALQRYLSTKIIANHMQQRILSGGVAQDLLCPFGFLKQVMALQVGSSLSVVPFLLLFVPIAMFVGSLDPPSIANGALYVMSLILAFVVNMLIWMHVGLLSFWMMQVNGIRAMIGVASNFLTGAIVPLWLMPDQLRFVIQLLPFQATNFLPASIYTGQVTGVEAIWQLVQQVVWIVVLTFTSRLVWKRAQRKIVVQGG